MTTTILNLIGISLGSALFFTMITLMVSKDSDILGAFMGSWMSLAGTLLFFCGILEVGGALPEYQGPEAE